MEDHKSKMVEQSFVVETVVDLSEDSFSEILKNLGYQYIKVVKMDSHRFIFSFLKVEDMESIVWEDSNIWIKNHNKANLSDFIQPRLAWVKIYGLPFVANSIENFQTLVGQVGKILLHNTNNVTNKVIHNPCLCISTSHLIRFRCHEQLSWKDPSLI